MGDAGSGKEPGSLLITSRTLRDCCDMRRFLFTLAARRRRRIIRLEYRNRWVRAPPDYYKRRTAPTERRHTVVVQDG
jgi:hypothetical protein